MPIPSYDQWIADTKAGFLKVRSAKLKEVDKAIEKYWKAPTLPESRRFLRQKLDEWMTSKDEWTDSIRNKKGAVQQLFDELKYALVPIKVAWTPPVPDEKSKGSVYLAASFGLANTLERREISMAVERAKDLAAAAYRHIALVSLPGGKRDTYVRWFGAYDPARAQIVRKNINAIWGALHERPVIVYYRGDKAHGPNDCPGETGDLAPGDFYGAAWKPANLPTTLSAKFTYLFVGSAFFDSTHFGSDCTGGVFIHELSHAICGTDDVHHDGATTYGHKRCKKLAVDLPASAINNADCYEFFAEEMQAGMYRPKDLVLNLPPKAVINLTLRPK